MGTVDWAGVERRVFCDGGYSGNARLGSRIAKRRDMKFRPEPFYEEHILVGALRNAENERNATSRIQVHMPITTDGSVTKIFTGTERTIFF